MKVKELIKELQRCRQNAEVKVVVDYTFEYEDGNNPRTTIEGVNEETFYDNQYDEKWNEAILILAPMNRQYINRIKMK